VPAMARRGGNEEQRDCQERSRSRSFHFPLDSSEGRPFRSLSVPPRISARPSASGRPPRNPHAHWSKPIWRSWILGSAWRTRSPPPGHVPASGVVPCTRSQTTLERQ
jgi:hypothetical protein